MTSTVDTSAALAPAIARFDRQRADARQQRWMAELEQAMLAQQPQARQQRETEPLPVPVDGAARNASQMPASVASMTSASGEVAARLPDAQRSVGQPRGQEGQSVGLANASANMQSESKSGPAAPAQAQLKRQAEPALLPQAQPGRATTPSGRLNLGEAAFASIDLVGATQECMIPDVARSIPFSLRGAATVPAAGEPEAAPPATELKPVAIVRIASAGGAWTGQVVSADEIGVPDGSADEGRTEAGGMPGEEYEKQLLHLFHGDDGVNAYIRDADLGGARLRAVAQAMAAELSAGGTRLAGLTVNGRRVNLANGEGHDEEAPVTAYEAAHPPIIQKGSI